MSESTRKLYTVDLSMAPFDVWLVPETIGQPAWYRVPSWRVQFHVDALEGVDVRLHKSLTGLRGWALSEASTGFLMYGGHEHSGELNSGELLDGFVTYGLPKLTQALVAERIAAARARLRKEVPVSSIGSAQRPRLALMWTKDTFGDVGVNPVERSMRFIEEAIELVHALGLSAKAIAAIVARVYARDSGNCGREFGQAQLTLELLAEACGFDLDRLAAAEFARIQQIPQAEWQRRHKAKADIGIALSQSTADKVDDNTRVLELHAALHHSLQNTDEAIEHMEVFAGEVLTWCREVLTREDLPPADRQVWQRRADLVARLIEPQAAEAAPVHE
jgi:hypothetical protein